MRKLHLLRHAQASGVGSDDHGRPLTREGGGHAARLAQHLARGSFAPRVVLCSSARRAVETFEPLRAHLQGEALVHIEPALYLAECDQLLERIRAVEAAVVELLLIAHNPGVAELAHFLAGDGAPETMARLARGVPAGTLISFRSDGPGWERLARGTAYLAGLMTPEDLS